MRLFVYFATFPQETYGTLALRAQVSRQTISAAARGATIEKYALAKRISLATNGHVSIAELCEPPELHD